MSQGRWRKGQPGRRWGWGQQRGRLGRAGFTKPVRCAPGPRSGLRWDSIFQMWEERRRKGENSPKVTQLAIGTGPSFLLVPGSSVHVLPAIFLPCPPSSVGIHWLPFNTGTIYTQTLRDNSMTSSTPATPTRSRQRTLPPALDVPACTFLIHGSAALELCVNGIL